MKGEEGGMGKEERRQTCRHWELAPEVGGRDMDLA